ncbi:hypothetical protein [Lysobacter enzymogenes]|uniref:hypothetical protein n=1 Tax=Lysobacter enzymogenes TaxID=69 RepID=UPI001A96D8D7|nr:hypothetical protein [Lysobacter enzymogenes]QQP96519.1 hypothetical protein JHW38_00225 [Lysobacter enzymogenes]
MTPDQARRLQGLINVQAEAEREYVRAKLRYSSTGRKDGWSKRLKDARAAVKSFIAELDGETMVAQAQQVRHSRDAGANEERQANAHLIAAAPELYAALAWYVENDDTNEEPENGFWLDGRDRAKAALAKARGQANG